MTAPSSDRTSTSTRVARARACDVRQRLLDDAVDRRLQLGVAGAGILAEVDRRLDLEALDGADARRRAFAARAAGPSSSSAAGRSSVMSARRFSISRATCSTRIASARAPRRGPAPRAAAASRTLSAAECLQRLVVQLARPAAALGLGRVQRGRRRSASTVARSRPRSPRWRRTRAARVRRRRRTSARSSRRSNARSTPSGRPR